MDDNMRFPKKKFEATNELILLLKTVKETKELYKSKELVKTLLGETNALIKSHKTDILSVFGSGKSKDSQFWMALIRQVLVKGYLKKDIEAYGLILITPKGKEFLKSPESFMMTEDHNYKQLEDSKINIIKHKQALDNGLMELLINLRKKVASQNELPPYTVFQENSLEEMCLKYPISLEELVNINGVGEGKAKRYGKEFLDIINRYVEDNEILRPDDLVVKSTGVNSSLKLYLIQSIDRKLLLEDISDAKGMTLDELISEMETIIFSGTKLNIDYYLEDIFDDDQMEELYNYFIGSHSDSIKDAIDYFDGDYEEEEIRLYRIKFLSEIAN